MTLDIKTVKEKDFVYTLKLEGVIDAETTPALEKMLNGMNDANTTAIMLDMSGVTYVSSVGIGVIMKARKEFQQRNISFDMHGLQPQVKKVMDAMKVLSPHLWKKYGS